MEEFAQTNEEFNNFSKKNKFIGCFRTSAKNGLNVNESMDFFMNRVIINLEAKINVFEKRNSIVLDRTMVNEKKKRKNNGCC